MSKPEAKDKPVRMFVALDLPEIVRGEIEAWGRAKLNAPALRRVEPEALHVTLAFLGNRPLSDVEPLEEVLVWLARQLLPMELGAAVARPERGKPRLIALPVLGGPVQGLGMEARETLSYEGFYKPEKRPFWPHVTVARVRNEGGGSQQPKRVEAPSGPSPTERIGSFDAVRISLYRSELQPRGARYVPLAQVELPGTGQQ